MNKRFYSSWWEYENEEFLHRIYYGRYDKFGEESGFGDYDLTLCNKLISITELYRFRDEEDEKLRCEACRKLETVLELGE